MLQRHEGDIADRLIQKHIDRLDRNDQYLESLIPVGSVIMWAGDPATVTPPPGWVICDGRALPRGQYQALWRVIGDRYNTATEETHETGRFRVPDFRARTPAGANPVGAVAARVGGVDSYTVGTGSDNIDTIRMVFLIKA